MTQPGPLLDVFGRNYGIRRQSPSNPANLTQGAWHIDAVTGSDTNDGSATAPLKTLAQLTQVRWGKGATLEPANAARTVEVFIESDIPPTDPLILDVVLGANVSLIFRGTLFTSVFAGTLTAATAVNRAANQAATVTHAIAPWAANTGQRIRNTTAGPRLNSVAGIAADLGAGVARISRPWINLFSGTVPTFLSPGAFVALDTYVIETVAKVRLALVTIEAHTGISGTQFPAIDFVDLDLETDTFAFAPFNIGAGAALQMFTCRVPLIEVQGGTNNFFNDIYKDTTLRVSGGPATGIFGGLALNAAGFFAPSGVGATLLLALDPLVQASVLEISGDVTLDDVGVFDSPTNGIETNPAPPTNQTAEAVAFFGTGALYGAGNANAGYHGGTDTTLMYGSAAVLTITGVVAGDFECGATGVLDTPSPASWNFTGAIAQTWANLAAARPGGFGGTVINPANMARILPFVP